MNQYDSESDAELVKRFKVNFVKVAAHQGRLAYFVMSMHAIHPHFLNRIMTYSASRLLYYNMVYGIGILIYSRANMKHIRVFNRISFSVLGSLMFNFSSMAVFNWIRNNYAASTPHVATFMSLFAGRIFMLHLLAYLYHVDRKGDSSIPRNSALDTMYYRDRQNQEI